MSLEHTGKLKVLMVHLDPCIRVLKEVQALCKKNVVIDVLCLDLTNVPQLRNYVQNIHIAESIEVFQSFLAARHCDWDIIHCHNEPNFITLLALVACDKRPVIYDCHDMAGARSTLTDDDAAMEKICFTQSQGVVHVSEGLKNLALRTYGPTLGIVLPSFPLAHENKIGDKPKLNGIHVVYQGGLIQSPHPDFSYRYYLPMFQELLAAGVHVHAYPSAHAENNNLRNYATLAAETTLFHLHDSLPYEELISTMSQYQWGFSGFNMEHITNPNTRNFLHSALPNKFFDYLLAGVCPVVINNKTAAYFAVQHDVGYAAKDMKSFVEICTTRQPLPPLSDLMVIDMSRQIERLLELYKAAMASKPRAA